MLRGCAGDVQGVWPRFPLRPRANRNLIPLNLSMICIPSRPQPSLQAPRRLLEDVIVDGGAYFRCHLHPKRFPVACSPLHDAAFWRSRVVHEDAGCVVVNKLPGLQVCDCEQAAGAAGV